MRCFFAYPYLGLLSLLGILALPPALEERSFSRFVGRFAISAVLSFFGVVLPIGVFVLSIFLTPEWKGACTHGWIDCFMLGKLALTPLVLWASAALYAGEVGRIKDPTQTWIVLGFSIGAIVSTACSAFGMFFINPENASYAPWLLAPFYTSVWYLARITQLSNVVRLRVSHYLKVFFSSLPFWLGSLAWSWKTYQNLPEHAPAACFVVTAAARGHSKFVGPFIQLTRRGHCRFVNRQLATFWQFEALWSAFAPASHGAFRTVYNCVGPVLARKINSPLKADFVHLVLRPAELMARSALRLFGKNEGTK
jgi:hypothetical protein